MGSRLISRAKHFQPDAHIRKLALRHGVHATRNPIAAGHWDGRVVDADGYRESSFIRLRQPAMPPVHHAVLARRPDLQRQQAAIYAELDGSGFERAVRMPSEVFGYQMGSKDSAGPAKQQDTVDSGVDRARGADTLTDFGWNSVKETNACENEDDGILGRLSKEEESMTPVDGDDEVPSWSEELADDAKSDAGKLLDTRQLGDAKEIHSEARAIGRLNNFLGSLRTSYATAAMSFANLMEQEMAGLSTAEIQQNEVLENFRNGASDALKLMWEFADVGAKVTLNPAVVIGTTVIKYVFESMKTPKPDPSFKAGQVAVMAINAFNSGVTAAGDEIIKKMTVEQLEAVDDMLRANAIHAGGFEASAFQSMTTRWYNSKQQSDAQKIKAGKRGFDYHQVTMSGVIGGEGGSVGLFDVDIGGVKGEDTEAVMSEIRAEKLPWALALSGGAYMGQPLASTILRHDESGDHLPPAADAFAAAITPEGLRELSRMAPSMARVPSLPVFNVGARLAGAAGSVMAGMEEIADVVNAHTPAELEGLTFKIGDDEEEAP